MLAEVPVVDVGRAAQVAGGGAAVAGHPVAALVLLERLVKIEFLMKHHRVESEPGRACRIGGSGA